MNLIVIMSDHRMSLTVKSAVRLFHSLMRMIGSRTGASRPNLYYLTIENNAS